MKKIFTFLLTLSAVVTAWAGTNSVMKITLHNGDAVYVSVASVPSLQHHYDAELNDYVVTITTADNKLEYAIGAVAKYEFVEEADGIEQVLADTDTKPSFVLNGKHVSINGCTNTVNVYSAAGTLTTSAKPNANGHVSIDLSAQPTGVYVIKISNSQTLKVSIR